MIPLSQEVFASLLERSVIDGAGQLTQQGRIVVASEGFGVAEAPAGVREIVNVSGMVVDITPPNPALAQLEEIGKRLASLEELILSKLEEE